MLIKGNDIDELTTIKSMYAGNNIRVFMNNGSEYRITTDTITKFLRGQLFRLEKKRRYEYLIPDNKYKGLPEGQIDALSQEGTN